MEKKYLMLLPLAIPLFFGGKAAVTAIKRKSHPKVNGYDDLDNIKAVTSGDHSRSDDIVSSEINSKFAVNPDAEFPGEDEPEKKTLGGASENLKENHIQGKEIFTGPKGGKYYFNDTGKKIYLK